MNKAAATIVVIDDDPAVRQALRNLLASVDFTVADFPSVQDFLASPLPDGPFCLVLDVRLPGRSGLDLQQDLARTGLHPPIIFMSGHGDIPMTVRAMKAGAVEFLVKPFRDQDLLDAIQVALSQDKARRAQDARLARLRSAFATLTAREKEVMTEVARGLLNKQIAAGMGLSEITVKAHRGQVMRKMGARSVPDLVRMSDSLGLGGAVEKPRRDAAGGRPGSR